MSLSWFRSIAMVTCREEGFVKRGHQLALNAPFFFKKKKKKKKRKEKKNKLVSCLQISWIAIYQPYSNLQLLSRAPIRHSSLIN
jgi:hypothetical protein